MAISQANNDQLDEALEMLGNSSVDVVYLVDSYGSLYPESAGTEYHSPIQRRLL